jgi:importin subunit beta-1
MCACGSNTFDLPAVHAAGQSSPLSPFFKEIITNLLNASSRTDPSHTDSTRLQISAFEAINDMVRAASPDTLDTVGQLTPVFLQEIAKTFNMPAGSGEQREKQAELQGQLCGVLQVCGFGVGRSIAGC